ncbi:hypothetical protein WICMUC_005379 [Wickerhamomyces mucosus]|uniref:SH3 domain-containing protein n=1 Tax=Wickerhamomyces mucosus TaxID=1378264 RepID=A0A9P8P918_9ASCO|nr:hypothetical protein WICMUC_005379 [Wickerhamomyces mucosus]
MSVSPPQLPFRVRTIYSWSGSEKGDLGFIEGDTIEVDSLGDGNWWHGRLKRNKMSGNFPSNYVEIIREILNTNNHDMNNSKNTTFLNASVSKASSVSPERISAKEIREDDLQFSFQSSRHLYSDLTKTDKYAPQNPYSSRSKQHPNEEHQIPHSHSSPAFNANHQLTKCPLSGNKTQNCSLIDSRNKPLPPTHSVPVKSKSSANLNHGNSNNLDSPYSKLHYDNSSRKDNEFRVPYDPQTLQQSSSSNSHSSNVFSYSQGSYFTSSQSSNESSHFAMSDFSATSAGSYSRHRYDEHMKNANLNTSASGNNLLVDERKVKAVNSAGGLFKRIFQNKDAPPLPSMNGLIDSEDSINSEMHQWIAVKVDMNRANSLSTKERKSREKRIRETEGYIIFEPHKQLSNFNDNEVYPTGHKIDLNTLNLNHVDAFVKTLKIQKSQVMLPEAFISNEFSMRYSSKIEYLRALFVLCIGHFRVESSLKVSDEKLKKPILNDVFYTGRTDSFGIAYIFNYLARLFGIESNLIIGSLKTPKSITRHYWNSVLLNGEWRFIDVSLANSTNQLSQEFIADYHEFGQTHESFYFLAEPLNLIYTHIPDKYEDQHIIPPIDPMVALQLPPCYPSFFKNGLKISKFSNALTRLRDSEIFEVDLKVPKDIEINATVTTPQTVSNTLSQIYWNRNTRYCKIKGYLPNNAKTGFINVYSGIKGVQKTLANVHSLSMVIPITHEGQYESLEFVTRYPALQAMSNDLYIKQPQNKNLAHGVNYMFKIIQYPSNGLDSVNQISPKFSIAIQNPSGKVIKLSKTASSAPFGVWELTTKIAEVGTWRALASADNAPSLCVFAEWTCT